MTWSLSLWFSRTRSSFSFSKVRRTATASWASPRALAQRVSAFSHCPCSVWIWSVFDLMRPCSEGEYRARTFGWPAVIQGVGRKET